MRRSIVLIIGCLILIPFNTEAVSDDLDFFYNDVESLQGQLDLDVLENDRLEQELLHEQSDVLIPVGPDVETENMNSQLRDDEVSTTHVYVRENGIPVILDDVPLSEWFAPYVRDMAERGVISGYRSSQGELLGKFGPADSVTIEQLVKIVVEAAAIDQSKCPETPLNQSAVDSWSAPYISCAEYLGWSLFSDGTINPQRQATRAEVVTTTLEAFGREVEQATGDVFEDVSNTMPYRYAIETAAADNIVSGYSDESGPTGFFGPFDPVNRAETAKIVSLAIQVYGF